jgi:hypothetical protein
VVVRAPVQKPSCKVVVVEVAPAPPAPPAPLAANPLPQAPRAEENPKPLAEPNSVRHKDIVIRNFGGEY